MTERRNKTRQRESAKVWTSQEAFLEKGMSNRLHMKVQEFEEA